MIATSKSRFAHFAQDERDEDMNDQPTIATIMVAAGSVIVVVLGGMGTLWAILRRERRRDQKISVEVKREQNEVDSLSTNDALKHMRAVMKQRTEFYDADRIDSRKRHEADMLEVRKRITESESKIIELQEKEHKCQLVAARQEEEIKHLREDLTRVKSSVGLPSSDRGRPVS